MAGVPGPGPLPSWARWQGRGDRLYTVGVEDEVMLLHARDWSPARVSGELLAQLPRDMAPSVRPETHASVLELVTGVRHDVTGALEEVASLRSRLARRLLPLGLLAVSAGVHPVADRAQTEVSSSPRYRLIEETMRGLAHREPTLALHVHVGIPDAGEAVRVLNATRSIVPLLVALSANSPFSLAEDTGFASVRRVLFGVFPRTGTPREFGSYHDYIRAVERLVAPGAIPDPTFLWWDVRLQPRFGSVEVRAMDAQSAVEDMTPLVALIQSFARLVVETGGAPAPVPGEVVAENAFLAARDGMDARLVVAGQSRLVPVRGLVRDLVGACRPHAAALGCLPELEQVATLARAGGAARQRECVAQGGFPALMASLAQRFQAHDTVAPRGRRSGGAAPGYSTPAFTPA